MVSGAVWGGDRHWRELRVEVNELQDVPPGRSQVGGGPVFVDRTVGYLIQGILAGAAEGHLQDAPPGRPYGDVRAGVGLRLRGRAFRA